MTSFHDRMNADPPPEKLEGFEVDLHGMLYARFEAERDGRQPKVTTLHWHRPDGTELTYYRWVDDDGDWFYPLDEFERHAGSSIAVE